MSIATLSALEEADFTVEQARTLTRVLEEDHHNLATKDDIESTKDEIKSLRTATKEETQSIRGEIKSFRTATKDDINSLRTATKEETQSIRGEIKSLEARMATKDDIRFLEARMATKQEMKAELNKTTSYLIRWIVTGMFFNIGVLYMLLKYFGQ